MTKSCKHGETTLAEVTNISAHGFWLLIQGREYFLSFEDFPWFKKASVEEITTFELLHESLLHWPLLDIDLCLEIIEHPENYPLKAK